MNGSRVRWLAVVPAAVYATITVWAADPVVSAASWAVVVALTLPLAAMGTERFGAWWFAPAVVALVVTSALALSGADVTRPPVAAFVLGIVAGAPAFTLAVVGAARRSPAAATLGVIATLAVGTLDLAVVRGLGAARPTSPNAWSVALSQVVTDQATSLRSFATGVAVPAAPLSYTGDVVFDALAVLALFGLLLGWLDPTARMGASDRSAALRSPATPPSGEAPTPGLGRSGTRSLVVAVAAVLALEVAASISPVDALMAVAVAAPAVVVSVIALAGRAPAAGTRTG